MWRGGTGAAHHLFFSLPMHAWNLEGQEAVLFALKMVPDARRGDEKERLERVTAHDLPCRGESMLQR
jgi:hypothetical protein